MALARRRGGVFILRVNSKTSTAATYLKALADVGMGLVVGGCAAAILASVAWYCELATHFTPHLLGVAGVAAVIHLGFRRWFRLLACGGAAVFLGIPLFPYFYPKAPEPRAEGDRVYTALLLNLRRDHPQPLEVVEFLRGQNADLVLLQEVTPAWERRLRPLFGDYGHEVLQPRDHAFGIWLLSRLPLSEVRVLPGEEANAPYIAATVEAEGEFLHLVGVHPFPPVGRSKARDRNDRLAGAGEVLRKTDGHRMILGDLNCTPWSPYFKRLLRNADVVDSALGRGIHPTWFPGIPLMGLPVDHCLVSPSVALVSRTVGPDVGSDHRPLLVEFSLPALPPGKNARASR